MKLTTIAGGERGKDTCKGIISHFFINKINVLKNNFEME